MTVISQVNGVEIDAHIIYIDISYVVDVFCHNLGRVLDYL